MHVGILGTAPQAGRRKVMASLFASIQTLGSLTAAWLSHHTLHLPRNQQAWLQTEAGAEQTEVRRRPGCSCTHNTNFIHIDTKVDFSRNALRQRERVEWHVGGGQGIGERSSEGGGRKGGGQSVGQGGRTGQQELGLGKHGELGVAAPPPVLSTETC